MHTQYRILHLILYLLLLTATSLLAADWPSWRGPDQNGVSAETGLVSSWSPDGENLVWKAEFIGRSTPVVLDGRVYLIGRTGEGIEQRETIACFDAASGERLWEHVYNVFHTTIPFNRTGWASLAGDPETGYIYAHSIGGMFFCFDPDGDVVWSRSLTEEYGRISGYGGRVHTPVVDEDLVIISYLNSSWGEQVPGRHRYFAFDKHNGYVVWIATPGGRPRDTTYSVPVVAEINGQRLLIGGNADGGVYAMKVRTGEKVWGFNLSKRGLNTSVVVDDGKVYAAHSEENFDTTEMGRVVCIDATGSGDVTQTHEVWRRDGLLAGYTSPTMFQNRLYIIDNSANMHCLDAATGNEHWLHNIGTVGKGSPIWADGRLYAPEVNGGFAIIQPSANSATTLDLDNILTADGRRAEIYGSPAVAYGRIYLATEAGLFCLGDKDADFKVAASAASYPREKASSGAAPAHLQIVPTEILAQPGEKIEIEARAFDARGRLIEGVKVEWSLAGLKGKIDSKGKLTLDKKAVGQAGKVVAALGDLQGSARVRVAPRIPWAEDFENVTIDKNPAFWVGAGSKFKVRKIDGKRVLVKPPAPFGLHRSNVYLGPPNLDKYTIQVDLLGTKKGRRRPDMGLIANRYTLDLQGNHQRLQIRTWAAELRMAKTIDFAWDPDVWYTAKMKVEIKGDKAIIYGKVWPRDQQEPAAWTITAEDPLPNRSGSPGIYGYSPVDIYYDNLKIW